MISVKTMKEFLNRVVVFYNKAKRRSYNVDQRVVKGRARCIAAQTEEAFANFVCQSVLRKKRGFKALVDFPITIEGKEMKQKRYIDFILVKILDRTHYEILYMAELKMNIGWMRDRVHETIIGLREQIKNMRKGELSARSDGKGEERLSFVLSRRVKYDLVVVSGVNGDLGKLKKERTFWDARKDETTRLMILCDGAIEKGFKINEHDKSALDQRMRAAINGCDD